jgi:hypothetical protein
MKHIKINKIASLSLIVAIVSLLIGPLAQVAHAASLTSLSDTMSNVTQSVVSNHEIKFVTPTGVASGGIITLTFASGFTGIAAMVGADFDFAEGNSGVCSSATFTEKSVVTSGATASQFNIAGSGQVVTITSGGASATVAAGHCVRLRAGLNATDVTGSGPGTHQITNPTAGSYAITIAGSFGDTGTITDTIISNGVVAVSGTVNQSLTFSVSANTISFGTLSSSAPQYANSSSGSSSDVVAHTLAVATNGASGYTITVQGATLTAPGSFTITAIGATPAVSAPGTKQFGIYATKAGGVNGTIAAPYATASSFGYDATATTATTFASGTGATSTETYSLHYIANISPTTEAGSYSTSLTYVASGNF